MIYAIYRCLYGEDFIQESIRSIDAYVDKIFIFWDDKPWGDVSHCIYKGNKVEYPKKFDEILTKIRQLNNPKIELIYDHQFNNINQFTHFVNNRILPNYEKPDEIMIIEVDHVFHEKQIKSALKEFREGNYTNASTSQVEIWKGFRHRIPDREYRNAVIFWNLKNLSKLPDTLRQGDSSEMVWLSSYVHNFGFAVSDQAMYWKHMTALGFSQKIGDSGPNEAWLEDKWLSWDYSTNNENLEISAGYEHTIPKAIPYDISELPKLICEKLNKGVMK